MTDDQGRIFHQWLQRRTVAKTRARQTRSVHRLLYLLGGPSAAADLTRQRVLSEREQDHKWIGEYL